MTRCDNMAKRERLHKLWLANNANRLRQDVDDLVWLNGFGAHALKISICAQRCAPSTINFANLMFQSFRDRQAGLSSASSPVQFQHHFGQSLNLIHRLQLDRKLEGHDGCVNTVAFTPSGEALVSGSDDLHINIWDWQKGAATLRFHSGHRNNVFQAKALPQSADKTVITCAADGQVRAAFISEDGQTETKKLAKHNGRAHKLALEVDQPQCFLSSGEDGAVLSFDLRTRKCTKLLVCKTPGRLEGTRPLSLNSIHCNPARPWQFVVAGSDAYVRVYDRRKAAAASSAEQSGSEHSDADCIAQQNRSYAAALATPIRKLAPKHLAPEERSSARMAHVTCANFSRQGEIVATYNDEDVYLFAPEGSKLDRGRARSASATCSSPAKRAKTANQDDLDSAHGLAGDCEIADADISGSRALSSSMEEPEQATAAASAPPSSSSALDSWHNCLEDDEVLQRYSGHLNSETVKGVSFMGVADEFVVSGSDCGHVFIWSKQDGKLQKLVKGDRHVVNCLEPHPFLPATLATSGIENDVKLWSPTAEEAHPPGKEAEEIMEKNKSEANLSGHPAMLSPQLIFQMLRMQQIPFPRTRRRQQPEGSNQEGSDTAADEEEEDGDDDSDEEARVIAERQQECIIS